MPQDMLRIDGHAHYLPEPYLDYLGRHDARVMFPWRLDDHLRFMERWSIEASVVSMPFPGLVFGDPTERREVARASNEAGAELIGTHGGRFAVLATTSLPDVEAATAEAIYALDELHLDGVAVLTNHQGLYQGDPALEPLYKELDRRAAVCFCHPTPPPLSPAEQLAPAVQQLHLPFMLETPFETTRAVANLVYGGSARSYPDIRWLFPHAGGTIPFLSARLLLAHAMGLPEAFNEALPGGPADDLARFYYDTALAQGGPQIRLLRTIVPLRHVLFGTDWSASRQLYADDAAAAPFLSGIVPRDDDPEPGVDDAMTAAERSKVERENALELFPTLRRRIGVSSAQQARSPG